jgi:hypothetical protein
MAQLKPQTHGVTTSHTLDSSQCVTPRDSTGRIQDGEQPRPKHVRTQPRQEDVTFIMPHAFVQTLPHNAMPPDIPQLSRLALSAHICPKLQHCNAYSALS